MTLKPVRTTEQIEAFRASLRERPIAVIGAGRSGMACVRRLAEAGAQVSLADSKRCEAIPHAVAEARALGAKTVCGFERFEEIAGARMIVASPGVPWDHPALVAAREAGVETIGTLELGYLLCPGPIIAVTGTNGKGTTCRLVSHILRNAGVEHILAGNIGEPLAEKLTDATGPTPVVVEVSSFQLEGIAQFHPRVATVLNVAPDHLDRHPSFEDYRAAKARIFENQGPEDVAIVNLDDPEARALGMRSAARKVTVSTEDALADVLVRDGRIIARVDGEVEICAANAFPLPGRHHLSNVLVATAITRTVGVAAEAIADGIAQYQGPAHHMEVVDAPGEIRFINDTKASNPSSAVADLSALRTPFVAIVGGKDKGADFGDLAALLSERARATVLIGESAARIADLMDDRAAVKRAGSMDEAVRLAAELAAPGDTVILAPACSSFDMFDDYAHRGRVFREAVRALMGA